MNKKQFQFAKQACWIIAAVGWFILTVNNEKNIPLDIIIFVFIMAGIVFNILEDKK